MLADYQEHHTCRCLEKDVQVHTIMHGMHRVEGRMFFSFSHCIRNQRTQDLWKQLRNLKSLTHCTILCHSLHSVVQKTFLPALYKWKQDAPVHELVGLRSGLAYSPTNRCRLHQGQITSLSPLPPSLRGNCLLPTRPSKKQTIPLLTVILACCSQAQKCETSRFFYRGSANEGTPSFIQSL